MNKKQILGWSLIGLFIAILFLTVLIIGGINALFITLAIFATFSIFVVGALLIINN